ncbi:uncharacterized protein ARMOST_18441 [Armillaria ostoyae]|uniref:Uncharacterized protein n=1 Tax=Armillaria ostoyae TaxID=47428 RepID=A0A284S1V5_ARMOS|nr:uncharacterized protein ARMOST_18441 [Armillaria ostoyae]
MEVVCRLIGYPAVAITGYHWIEFIVTSARCLADIKIVALSWSEVVFLGFRDGQTVFAQDVTDRRVTLVGPCV